MRLVLLYTLAFFFSKQQAQTQELEQKAELWLGYISSVRISEKLYLWNDFHFVPKSFFVSRHGLSYELAQGLRISGGYAWVQVSVQGNAKLERKEHRPWAQIEWRKKLAENYSLRMRYRHDWRYRQEVEGGQVQEQYSLTQRKRLMLGLRRELGHWGKAAIHIDILNEFLLNNNKARGFHIDQNRSYLLFGYRRASFTLLCGYDLRLIPNSSGRLATIRHGLTLWLIHSMNWRRKNC